MKNNYRIVVKPRGNIGHYWHDLWHYRELFYFLAWRDILVRYKQTAIGIAWSLIRPLVTIVVFTFIFGKIARLPSGETPYPVLVCAAMLPWQFFANAVSESSNSLVESANMVSKVYFPRIIIPASAIIVSLVDFAISLLILGVLFVWYGLQVNYKIIFLPLFLLLAVLSSLGLGLWLSALNVKYRDFRYVVPFIIQFGLFVSPVGFSSAVLPNNWRLLYSLNPMVSVIDGFRWTLLGDSAQFYLPGFFLSISVACITFFAGLAYFRKTERIIADII